MEKNLFLSLIYDRRSDFGLKRKKFCGSKCSVLIHRLINWNFDYTVKKDQIFAIRIRNTYWRIRIAKI